MIIGANGTTGRIVSKMLAHSKKYQAIAMIRKVEQTKFFNKLGIESCIGDLEQDFSDCLLHRQSYFCSRIGKQNRSRKNNKC